MNFIDSIFLLFNNRKILLFSISINFKNPTKYLEPYKLYKVNIDTNLYKLIIKSFNLVKGLLIPGELISKLFIRNNDNLELNNGKQISRTFSHLSKLMELLGCIIRI